MIERLVTSLQALAAEADVQLRRFRDVVCRPEELALDFDDALLLIRSCQQIELTPEQSRALAAVDTLLERMSGAPNAVLWTEAALSDRAEWQRVREAAVAALRALGHPTRPPGAAENVYVPGRRPAGGAG
jgi:hypothetical protein